MLLQNIIEKSSIFIFADIRGFSSWNRSNQSETSQLLNSFYELSIFVFGERKEQKYSRRIVKFLGDGFFAVNEYKKNNSDSLFEAILESLRNLLKIDRDFYLKLMKSTIHDADKIGVGYGVSFGNCERFNLPGNAQDYVGEKVNFASRLCSKADSSEILLEKDIYNRIYNHEIYKKFDEQELIDKDLKSYGKIKVGKLAIYPF